MRGVRVAAITVLAVLSLTSTALATGKFDTELVPVGYSQAISDNTEARAELIVGSCVYTTKGEVKTDRKFEDTAIFSEEATACGFPTTTEPIETVVWETKELTEKIRVALTGGMKYRATTPHVCTYETPTFEDTFAPTKHIWEVTSEGKLVEGEGGCASTLTVEGQAKLYDLVKPAYVNAEFRCELLEEKC